MFQIHLTGKGMSSRGVRCETLSLKEVDAAEKVAAVGINKETTIAEYNALVQRFGMEMMVRAVTEPVGKDGLTTAAWKNVDAQELSMNWAKYFNVKDTVVLKSVYDSEHNVSQAEVESIMAGKVEVLAE